MMNKRNENENESSSEKWLQQNYILKKMSFSPPIDEKEVMHLVFISMMSDNNWEKIRINCKIRFIEAQY